MHIHNRSWSKTLLYLFPWQRQHVRWVNKWYRNLISKHNWRWEHSLMSIYTMCQATNFWEVEQPSQLQYGREREEAFFKWRSHWSKFYRPRQWQWQFGLWIRCWILSWCEEVSANEENDMEDDSFGLPPSKFSWDGETVSNEQEGNCFTTKIM